MNKFDQIKVPMARSAHISRLPLYVIGFPKSGNTWLARMLADATRSIIETNGPNDIVNGADNAYGRNGPFIIKKRHFFYDGEYEEAMNRRFIYIIRDCRDVFVSGFFYCNGRLQDIDILSSPLLKYYFFYEILGLNVRWQGNLLTRNVARLRYLGAFLQVKNRTGKIGSWSEHVERWTKLPGCYVVSYEALCKSTHKELKSICDHLGLSIDDATIEAVVDNQSFANRKQRFIQDGDRRNIKFMRKGQPGDWQNYLPLWLVQRIEARHGATMKKFGYKLVTESEEVQL